MCDEERSELIREAYRLAREAGFHGFRRQFLDDAEFVAMVPDPQARERELRDFWDRASRESFEEFERTHAAASAASLQRYLESLRAECRLGDESRLFERASAEGRKSRASEPRKRTKPSEIQP